MRTHQGRRCCPHCGLPDRDDKHIGKCLKKQEDGYIEILRKNKEAENNDNKQPVDNLQEVRKGQE
jgi:hypothetical protein